MDKKKRSSQIDAKFMKLDASKAKTGNRYNIPVNKEDEAKLKKRREELKKASKKK